MARRRLHMRKTRQVLRLAMKERLPQRVIARSLKVGRQTVSDYLQRAKVAGISRWEDIKDLTEEELEGLLFPSSQGSSGPNKRQPLWQEVHTELKKTKGTTLYLLWKEYYEEDPQTAYSYSQFCLLYRRWRKDIPLELRKDYRGGEVMFVDYAGEGIPYIEITTGEEKRAEIFVGTLGASNLIYCEAQESQKQKDWIQGHINAFQHIGGVPEKVVPDNLKAGVKSPCYYEPEINPLYDDLSLHYDFVIMPTRVSAPRDKAKVENGVQQVERWIIAPLRNRQFFSIEEINRAIKPLLEELNQRVMKQIGKTRRELFEEIEKPYLKPLPQTEFEISERKTQKVGPDYHITYDRHHYSVPYTLAGHEVEIRATGKTIEVYHNGQRVSSHIRSFITGGYSTQRAHMPEAHQRVTEKITPEKLLRWARSTGGFVVTVIEEILKSRRHPEQAYRTCIGILSSRSIAKRP